jgi:predicted Zn-dependent peptidase
MGMVLDVAPGDRAALTIAVSMLSDRLAFDLRETKGLAYSIGASVRPWGGRTRFDVAMGTRPENLEEAKAGIVAGVRAFREATPTPVAVERAINVARGAALMRRMTRISLAYEAGMEAMRGLAPGDERRFVDALREVRAEDVKRVTTAYLDPDRLAVAVVR